MLKKAKLTWIIELVKKSPFAEMIKTSLHKSTKSELTPKIKMDLKNKFLSDVELIEKQLDIKLQHWK